MWFKMVFNMDCMSADQGTAPITPTAIAITTNINHRSQAIHSHNIIPLF